MVLDSIDRKIIGELVDNGRVSATELAKRISLSVSATTERLRRLTSSGVIAAFTVAIDPASIGRPIQALIDVRLASGISTKSIDEAILSQPGVINAMHLTGRFDMQLHVAISDVGELDQLLEFLKQQAGAEETNSRLVLRSLDGFPRPAQLL